MAITDEELIYNDIIAGNLTKLPEAIQVRFDQIEDGIDKFPMYVEFCKINTLPVKSLLAVFDRLHMELQEENINVVLPLYRITHELKHCTRAEVLKHFLKRYRIPQYLIDKVTTTPINQLVILPKSYYLEGRENNWKAYLLVDTRYRLMRDMYYRIGGNGIYGDIDLETKGEFDLDFPERSTTDMMYWLFDRAKSSKETEDIKTFENVKSFLKAYIPFYKEIEIWDEAYGCFAGGLKRRGLWEELGELLPPTRIMELTKELTEIGFPEPVSESIAFNVVYNR